MFYNTFMKIDSILRRLATVATYKLMIFVVLLSEIFTAIMNSINSYLWWGRIDTDLLLIGSIDAFIVSFLVGGLVVLVMRYYSTASSTLEESQSHFKQLVDNIPICLALVDSEGKIFYMNDHLTRTMGYTVEDVPDMDSWWPIGYPDDKYRAEVMRRWSKAVETAMAAGRPIVPEEYNVTCKDGSMLVMDIFGAPIGIYHLVIFDDQTERKKHEMELLESKEKYERVIDSSPIGITIYDATGRCITANRAIADIIGGTRQQVLQQNFHEIESWRRSGMYDAALRALESNRPEQIDVRLTSSFGQEIFIGCYMVPFVPDGLLFMAHDLSRLREAEDEIIRHRDHLEGLVSQRSEELARSEKRYRELINNTDTGFMVIDPEGVVLEANMPYLRLAGLKSVEDILGRSVIEWTAPECMEESAAAIVRCCEEGYIRNFEATYLRADGSRCIIQIDATTSETGAGMRITAFCRNITERKSLEAQRFRASRLESLGFMAGGIAHDFNNRLGTILNNIYMAKSHLDPESEPYRILANIERTYWQATHLSNQLLTFSKGIVMHRTVFSLAGLLEDTVKFTLSGSGIESRFEIDASLMPVEGDRGQISQVISNIALNAREAMGDEGHLTVRASNVDNSAGSVPVAFRGPLVRVEIEDTGAGISGDNLDRIFDPFFSMKESGHGIGLSLSHTVISKHGGIIEVRSQEGSGAVFTIYLPASVKAVQGDALRPAGASSGSPLRILLMDDDDDFRRSFAELMESLGHDVHQSSNGEDAVSMYLDYMSSGKAFDLVILDMTIKGGMGGVETFRRLKVMDPGVRALVASGYSDKLGETEYLERGFSGYLKKPIIVDELRVELDKYRDAPGQV